MSDYSHPSVQCSLYIFPTQMADTIAVHQRTSCVAVIVTGLTDEFLWMAEGLRAHTDA